MSQLKRYESHLFLKSPANKHNCRVCWKLLSGYPTSRRESDGMGSTELSLWHRVNVLRIGWRDTHYNNSRRTGGRLPEKDVRLKNHLVQTRQYLSTAFSISNSIGFRLIL
ncbi:hypothetical protein MAR_014877, partial [Mya arenaria]